MFLHVGVPKSGTSFIQSALRQNRDELLAQGVLFPSERPGEMFQAALDLNGNHEMWGLPRERVAGMWAELCRRAREFDGTTVVSSEFLCASRPQQIAQAVALLDGLEVHVVLTARDLARQLPAEWQEGIKHGRRLSFQEFQTRILDPERSHPHARRLWQHHDLPAVLDRWAAAVGDDRVHLITCPRPGADPALLWERFCGVVGIDASRTRLPEDAANVSLGITEIEVLRQVNRYFPHSDDPHVYGRVVKQFFVRSVLRDHSSARARTPAHLVPALEELTRRWRKDLESRGYRIVGDLAELDPVVDGEAPADDPDRVPPRQALQVAAASIADLLHEVHHLRQENRRLRHRLEERSSLPARAADRVRGAARRVRRAVRR